MKKRITALALAFVIVLSLTAMAAGRAKTITVSPMTMTINGNVVIPSKADGAPAEVFAYDGATYVPLRYLSELLGIEVAWDASDSATAKLVNVPGFPATSITDGTYTGSASGFGGEVTATVTVTGGKLTACMLKGDKETAGIGAAALPTLESQVIAAGSAAIDGVSGATMTSNGVKAAVEMALNAAKGIQSSTTSASLPASAQVVVVGGGGAGMVAAINLAENGIDTVLIEKNGFLGGATMTAGGGMITTCSKLQKGLGVDNDSPDLLYADLMKGAKNTNDPTMLRLYVDNIGSTVDWLTDSVGMEFASSLSQNAEYVVPRVAQVVNNAVGLRDYLQAKLESTHAKVFTSTKAEELIQDASGKVVGVKYTDSTGNEATIQADAVLMATGGFGANKDMLPDSLKSVLYYGPDWSMGDGLKMAQAIGAGTKNLTYGKIYPNGLEVDGRAVSTVYGTTFAIKQGSAILVNSKGKRVINETLGYPDITEKLLEEKDQTFYLIMDEISYQLFENANEEHGVSHDNVAKWIANNGASTPVYVKADSLKSALEAAGVDYVACKKTVEDFNSKVGTQDEFGRTSNNAIDLSGAIYVVEQKPRFATTLGGITINTNTEVLDTSGKVIPGLYGCGEVVCGPQGNDSLPGTNIGWAMTSGKLASETLISAFK